MKNNTPLPKLTALELERHVSLREAATIMGMSVDTFRRHYSHLIKKMSRRRDGVRLRDLLSSDYRREDFSTRRA
jgi:hypothetical protein